MATDRNHMVLHIKFEKLEFGAWNHTQENRTYRYWSFDLTSKSKQNEFILSQFI